jgi:lambda family phage portal protein
MIKEVKPTLSDKIIGFFSPELETKRVRQRAMTSFYAGGYPIPGDPNDRAMRGFGVSQNMADADILPGLGRMRAGSRDLFMNTPVPVAILKRFKTNVIGFGLSLQAQLDRKFLGLSDEQAEAWEELVEGEWCMWADSQECDLTRTQCFSELQALAFFSHMLSGDCFVALPYVDRPGSLYKLKVHVLEADMVSTPPHMVETYNLAGGVEVDENGAPIAYHLRTIPKDYSLYSNQANYQSILGTWKRIEAFGAQSGRRNMLHLFQKDRPSQRRGVPLLAPVLSQLKQISRLSEAELMAALVTAFFTVFLESNSSAQGLPSLGAASTILNPTTNPADVDQIEMGYASVVGLPNGVKATMVDPKRPNAAFDPFFTALVKQVSAAVELPYELVLMHFSASYSATRGIMVEAWKVFRERRIWVARNLCQPVYQEFLMEGVLSGRIKAPGFVEDLRIRAAWCGSTWTGPGQGQIDPAKETEAAKARIDARLSNHDIEYNAIHGNDWRGGMVRLASEKKFLKDNDIAMVEPAKASQPEADNADQTDTTTAPADGYNN